MNLDLVEKEFNISTGRVRQMLAKKLLNEAEIADLYALFQQATVGDYNDWKFLSNAGSHLFDLGSKDKHQTWMSHRGMSQLEAKERYSNQTHVLATKYGVIFPDHPSRIYGSVTSLATCVSYVP